MNKGLEKLTDEKRKKILEAGLAEFCRNGYEKASTNTIVKEAGISKGLLFHYFSSKKNLFLYVLDFAIDQLLKVYDQYVQEYSKDLFERLLQISTIKLKLFNDYPEYSKIIMDVYTNIPEELKDDLQSRYTKIGEKYIPNVFSSLDYSNFRKGVNPAKAMELIYLCIEAIGNKYMAGLKGNNSSKSPEEWELISKESMEFIEILKYGVYEAKDDSN